MAGTLKIEVSGATKEELKRQLEDVIRELDKINFRPGNRVTLGNPQLWKQAGNPQQLWKQSAGLQQLWKQSAGLHPSWAMEKWNPQTSKATGSLRAWTVTYET
jgi:hypothetical protein